MPDEGPRLERALQGIDGLAWQEGQSAYNKGAWLEARQFFESILKQHPASPLVPSAQAFLIEMSLRQDSSRESLANGVLSYKKLVRDYPQSQNARRAEWRIADLYLEQGWLQEAQAAYEQAMGHSRHLPFDGHRALLGLGNTYMAMRKWSEAEHAFATLRKHSDHDGLSQRGTIGLAHALYRQRRLGDAQAVYQAGYRRWPKLFRLDPLALQRFAATEGDLRHDDAARELLILFYNLYPRHAFAPTALLRVADSLLTTARPSLAELFYALTSSLYKDSIQGTVAQMRLMTQRAERLLPAGQNGVGLAVQAMMHGAVVPDQNDAAYRAALQAVAARHADDATGTEALFHLGRSYEQASNLSLALLRYKEAAFRAGPVDDPWAPKASDRLAMILRPWIEAAQSSHDDLTVVTLFHWHGPNADQLYAQTPFLLTIADAHRRLGFSLEAVRLYQRLVGAKDPALLEPTFLGLSQTYLDQQDAPSARKVLERYRFQFPTGRYSSDVLHLLVTAMRSQGDLQGLLHLCRTWLMHHPTHPERSWMYLQLAATLGLLKQDEAAALAYEEAFKDGAARSPEPLLAYADTLSRLNQHAQAVAAYRSVLEAQPAERQAEWAHLQIASLCTTLKQYDRAAAALADLGTSEDPLINRYSSSFKGGLEVARRLMNERAL